MEAADEAILHMQGAAGEEADAVEPKNGRAAAFDVQALEHDNVGPAGIDDDGGGAGGRNAPEDAHRR